MMAVFLEKIVQGIVQPDRTGHDRVLQRKSVCFTPVMHGPIFSTSIPHLDSQRVLSYKIIKQ